jgi:hypothetical protein
MWINDRKSVYSELILPISFVGIAAAAAEIAAAREGAVI